MPEETLSGALYSLKDRKPIGGPKGAPEDTAKRTAPKAHPRAFDTFYAFGLMLLALGIALQVIAVILYS